MPSETKTWRSGTVVESRPIAADIRRIVIESAQPARTSPGSHVDVAVPVAGRAVTRSYSVVDASTDGRSLAISVLQTTTSRGGSHHMHSLRQGQRIQIRGPLQNFPLTLGADRYLLLAGGIGITAILGMARSLRDGDADYRLIYTGRTRAAMAYLRELTQTHRDRLAVRISGDDGRVQIDELLASVDDSTQLYMCGPLTLMRQVQYQWSQRCLPAANLRYETFGDAAASQQFIVKIPRLGVQTVVQPGATLLDALGRAGIEVMSDCRTGECGLCEVDVLGVVGVIDHRDVFYSRRQQQSDRRMCSCVSRVIRGLSDHVADGSLPEIIIDVASTSVNRPHP